MILLIKHTEALVLISHKKKAQNNKDNIWKSNKIVDYEYIVGDKVMIHV